MFGRKQEAINKLQGDLGYVRERRDIYYTNWQKSDEELARAKSEISIVQIAYREQKEKIEDLHVQVGDLETRNESLKYDNANLREEATESSRMLELYKALVASLRIVIKLPARKK